jgi:exopolysaccharide production protein ExoZ
VQARDDAILLQNKRRPFPASAGAPVRRGTRNRTKIQMTDDALRRVGMTYGSSCQCDGERTAFRDRPTPRAAPTVSNIQALRGIAALLVVYFHLQPVVHDAYGEREVWKFGVAGVDIFFIISGFVMFYANRTQPNSIKRFLAARVLRIMPLYWLATLLIVGLFAIGLRPNGVHYLDAAIVAKSLFLIKSTFPDGRYDLVLNLGWTLIFEMFFYVVFAGLLIIKSDKTALNLMAGLFLLTSSLGFVFRGSPWFDSFVFSTLPIEFLYGAFLGFAYRTYGEKWPSTAVGLALGLTAIATLIAIELSGVPGDVLHGRWRFLLLGVPSLMIVAGALIFETAGIACRWRLPLLIGAASYALYLFHPIFLQAAVKIASAVAPVLNSTGASFAAIWAAIVGAIIIYMAVDSPLLSLSKRIMRASFKAM